MIRFVGVVVPAHDEEDLIGRCLASIQAATRHPRLRGVEVRCVTVLDSCSDRTGDRAAVVDGTGVVEVTHGNVGAARAEGMRAMLSVAAGLDPSEVWLSTTDADTLVPRHWLARQMTYAHRGAGAVAGTVEVDDWSQQPASTQRTFLTHQRQVGTGLGHGHVHGANLGLSAAAYLASGGMPPLALAEDRALWELLQARGQRLVSAPDLAVVTSARRESRASGGFSSFLRSL